MLTATAPVSERPQKKVCFQALDWDEEDQRTERGVELRRQEKERRQLRKMAAARIPIRPDQALDVLMDVGIHDRLCLLARDEDNPSFNLNFTAFYQGLHRLNERFFPTHQDMTFRQKLEKLRSRQRTGVDQYLNTPTTDLLRTIGNLPVFQPFLNASNQVSSGSEHDINAGESKDDEDEDEDEDKKPAANNENQAAAAAPAAATEEDDEDGNVEHVPAVAVAAAAAAAEGRGEDDDGTKSWQGVKKRQRRGR
jgi:hypothetical protein